MNNFLDCINFSPLLQEFEEQKTKEALFVKDLDRFDMILQAHDYEVEANRRDGWLQEFFDSTEGNFRDIAASLSYLLFMVDILKFICLRVSLVLLIVLGKFSSDQVQEWVQELKSLRNQHLCTSTKEDQNS